MPRVAVKTATPPAFSPDDMALISEALRIARCEIADNANSLERIWPQSPLVERTRIFAERMQDLRERIDA